MTRLGKRCVLRVCVQKLEFHLTTSPDDFSNATLNLLKTTPNLLTLTLNLFDAALNLFGVTLNLFDPTLNLFIHHPDLFSAIRPRKCLKTIQSGVEKIQGGTKMIHCRT